MGLRRDKIYELPNRYRHDESALLSSELVVRAQRGSFATSLGGVRFGDLNEERARIWIEILDDGLSNKVSMSLGLLIFYSALRSFGQS